MRGNAFDNDTVEVLDKLSNRQYPSASMSMKTKNKKPKKMSPPSGEIPRIDGAI